MGKQDMVAWQPEDDLQVMSLHSEHGPQWSRIASLLRGGRTVASVRNRFLRVQSAKKLREKGGITRNRCHLCGEPKRGHICTKKISLLVTPCRSLRVPMTGVVVDGLGGQPVVAPTLLGRQQGLSSLQARIDCSHQIAKSMCVDSTEDQPEPLSPEHLVDGACLEAEALRIDDEWQTEAARILALGLGCWGRNLSADAHLSEDAHQQGHHTQAQQLLDTSPDKAKERIIGWANSVSLIGGVLQEESSLVAYCSSREVPAPPGIKAAAESA